MELVSVNVSQVRQVEHRGRLVGTGIFREPVEGRVALGRLTLAGDRQVDFRHHGGPDKAVCAYPCEHYAVWREELGRDDLSYGHFGENFTVSGLPEDETCIGDRFRVGTAVVEVTQPREPCFKLGIRMGDPRFPEVFRVSERVGYYLRVIEEGDVAAGDAIKRVDPVSDGMSVREVFHLCFFDSGNREGIARALSLPALSKEWRRRFAEL